MPLHKDLEFIATKVFGKLENQAFQMQNVLNSYQRLISTFFKVEYQISASTDYLRWFF